jgi:hypothetical protein
VLLPRASSQWALGSSSEQQCLLDWVDRFSKEGPAECARHAHSFFEPMTPKRPGGGTYDRAGGPHHVQMAYRSPFVAGVMIENYRSGLVWRCFMSNPEVQSMLQKVGFRVDAPEGKRSQ